MFPSFPKRKPTDRHNRVLEREPPDCWQVLAKRLGVARRRLCTTTPRRLRLLHADDFARPRNDDRHACLLSRGDGALAWIVPGVKREVEPSPLHRHS
jgi:hypothetical protein